jgi:hypothetical protein
VAIPHSRREKGGHLDREGKSMLECNLTRAGASR